MFAMEQDVRETDDEDEAAVAVKIEDSEPWQELVPVPQTAVTHSKAKAARAKRAPLKLGKLMVSYPWREDPQDSYKMLQVRVSELLQKLSSATPGEELLASMDLDVTDIRLKQPSEWVQEAIDQHLDREDLLGPNGDRPAKVRKTEALLSTLGLPTRTVPSLPSYKEFALQRWRVCSDFRTALTLLDSPKDWKRCVKENAVHGNPHKRCCNQILARHKLTAYPQSQEGEMECVNPPDLSQLPKEVKRVAIDELIFTVAVCDESGQKQQEYDLLGTQSLHDLRDALYFVSDWTYDGPTRQDSGCMFIDGVFYSDMRSAHSVDYALELIKYLEDTKNSDIPLREEKSRSMAARLCDIQIPFGEKCCYIRQGDIEHFMYFTGVRRFNDACDCPLEEPYPVLTFMQVFHKRFCDACLQNQATWVIHGATRVPHDPMYFCYICFEHFFKDKQGELIKPVDYKVFPYLHD